MSANHNGDAFPLPPEDPMIESDYKKQLPESGKFYKDRLSGQNIESGVPEDAFSAAALASEIGTPEVFDRVAGKVSTGHAEDQVATAESWREHHPDGMAPGTDIDNSHELIDPEQLHKV